MKQGEFKDLTKDQLEQAKKIAMTCVDLGESVKRLHSNPDFQKVISYYFNNECIRLVHALGDPAVIADEKALKGIKYQMYGISSFESFLNFLMRQGEIEKKTLQEIEDYESGKASVDNNEDAVIQ